MRKGAQVARPKPLSFKELQMANRVGTALLNHFTAAEFHLPDQMDATFLLFLDGVRDRAGIPFVLNSDARSAQHNTEIGGVPTSLHLFDPGPQGFKARAVDFSISDFENKLRPWASFAKIAEAVISVWHEQNLPSGYELEFQYGDKNKHVHLGLFREPGHECRIVLKSDVDAAL